MIYYRFFEKIYKNNFFVFCFFFLFLGFNDPYLNYSISEYNNFIEQLEDYDGAPYNLRYTMRIMVKARPLRVCGLVLYRN